jgi:hypothetical protein
MKLSNLKSQRLAGTVAMLMLVSIFIYAPQSASAAVQFGNFTATMGQGNVMCSWETISQTSNASFTVEKAWAPSGRSQSLSWTPLTSMQGAGNSHSTITYTYTDNAPGYVGNQQVTDGYLLYRIKATDFEGHSTATNPKAVRWSSLTPSTDNAIAPVGDEDTRTAFINFFSAKAKNTNVYCTWQSQLFVDNSVYTVERSTNGTTFTPFATVNGDGVTIAIQKYTVIDYNVTASVVYYRLAQFDAGVGTSYSPVRKVILSGGGGGRPEETATLSSFTSEQGLHVNYNSATAGAVNLIVSDCLGKLITERTLEAEQGNNTYAINDVNLRQGIYHVTVVKDGEALTKTIVKNQ